MAYENQKPSEKLKSSAYYNERFIIDDDRSPPSDVKSAVIDKSNFQFEIYGQPQSDKKVKSLFAQAKSENRDVTTDDIPRIEILSQNVTQVSINSIFPKMEPIPTPMGSYANLNMQSSDFDGFEFIVKYAMKAGELERFIKETEVYTNKRKSSPYKSNQVSNLFAFVNYYGLDPFNGLNRGVNDSIAFNYVYILDVSISSFSYDSNSLAEVIITYNANEILL